MIVILLYKQFFIQNLDGAKSIHNRMKSLKKRWEPVWEVSQGVPGFTWVVNGISQTFNHKSLDFHRLPFVDYNPTDPYSLIMSMVLFASLSIIFW